MYSYRLLERIALMIGHVPEDAGLVITSRSAARGPGGTYVSAIWKKGPYAFQPVIICVPSTTSMAVGPPWINAEAAVEVALRFARLASESEETCGERG